jgi:hypothetical protein
VFRWPALGARLPGAAPGAPAGRERHCPGMPRGSWEALAPWVFIRARLRPRNPAYFRPIPQKGSAWDAHNTAKETKNRQGEVGFLRYSSYVP